MSPVLILNVAENANGGIGTYFRQMVENASAEVCLSFVLPKKHVKDVEKSHRTYSFDHEKRSPLTVFKIIRCLRSALADPPPDIVVFHSFFSIPAMVYSKFFWPNIPRVYVPHGWTPLQYPTGSLHSKIARFFEMLACFAASTVISVSRFELTYANETLRIGKHVLVENAVNCPGDPKPINKPASDGQKVHLLFVGRFDRQKGLDILLQAFNSAIKVNPALYLTVIGSFARDRPGPVDELRIGSQENCSVHDWLSSEELTEYYSRADALVVPSRWEAYGYVVNEAACFGTPSIVSDRGDLPNRIKNGQTGIVVELPVSDEPGPLKACLERLDHSQLQSMRNATQKNARLARTSKQWMSELESIFRQLKKG